MIRNDTPGDTPDFVLDRRRLLKSGGLGVLGLGATGLARGGSSGTGSADPIRSCILIFYYGGPSHLDTWDLKPKAPKEVRGEFGSIATSVPGIRVGEHMPHSARVVDRLAI